MTTGNSFLMKTSLLRLFAWTAALRMFVSIQAADYALDFTECRRWKHRLLALNWPAMN